jgi:hypothetical protein
MCFCFVSFETIRRWRGAPRQQQIDKATNNKQERDKRTRHIFDIKLLRCFLFVPPGLFFFSFSLLSLTAQFFKGTKESKFVGTTAKRRKKLEKNQEMGRKKDDKNVDTTHTFLLFCLLTDCAIVLFCCLFLYPPPSWFVCFPIR